MRTTTAIPCKRPKISTEPAPVGGLYNHACLVPGCGWSFISVKTAQDVKWHRDQHKRAVLKVELDRGERGFVATCECGWKSYAGAETSRQSVEQTTALRDKHGLVSC